MEATTAAIVDFVAGIDLDAISDHTFGHVRRRLVDSFGCAVAAIDSPPARIVRGLASETTSSASATVLGLARPSTVELAAFANTVMVRYLDCNDMHFTSRGGGGHPSDMIPTALAVGESLGATGPEVMQAIVVGYEVNGALASAVWLREKGWDQGLNIVAATSMMTGKLFGLSREALGHALALAVTPNVPVRQTRVGHLSMWKGCATAGAARNGIFAAVLAQRGMTGPPKPFEGSSGIWDQVTGPFELQFPVSPGEFVVEDVHTKIRPAEYNAQGPIDLILDVRGSVDVDEIEAIELETYWLAYHEIGMDAPKWDPQTRETADHSLPYLLAVALVDGRIDQHSCDPERVVDPALRPLMNKISIRERPEFTARFPSEVISRLVVRTRDGAEIERQTSYPRGHRRNPVSDAEIDEKFERMIAGRSDHDLELCAQLRERLWSMDEVKDVGDVMRPLGRLSATEWAANQDGAERANG
jgi:2-methylcitrate dehydratase